MNNERLNYTQLCKKFNEPKKKSSRRTEQFQKWRKEWSIERDGNTHFYFVHKLSKREKEKAYKKTIQRISNRQYLLPMIVQQLTRHADIWDATMLERQQTLGLINKHYQIILSTLQKEIFANEYKLNIADIETFGEISYEINSETIRRIRNYLTDIGYINYEKIFEVVYESGSKDVINKKQYLAGDEMQEIEKYRNMVTRQLLNNPISTFYTVKDKDMKKLIKQKVNEHFGFKYHADGERWRIDDKTVQLAYDYKYSYEMAYLNANKNACITLSKSQRGDLKYINQHDQDTMVDCMIDVDKNVVDSII
jgi:uncharacterized protein YlaI